MVQTVQKKGIHNVRGENLQVFHMKLTKIVYSKPLLILLLFIQLDNKRKACKLFITALGSIHDSDRNNLIKYSTRLFCQ